MIVFATRRPAATTYGVESAAIQAASLTSANVETRTKKNNAPGARISKTHVVSDALVKGFRSTMAPVLIPIRPARPRYPESESGAMWRMPPHQVVSRPRCNVARLKTPSQRTFFPERLRPPIHQVVAPANRAQPSMPMIGALTVQAESIAKSPQRRKGVQ